MNQSNLTPNSPFIDADNSASQLPLHVATLYDVRAGKAMPFTRDEMSAINKVPVNAPVAVNYLGLVSDEQADRRHHGGHLKAVHQIATATYTKLNAEFKLKLTAGLLGENLITTPVAGVKDLDEATVCIGDVFQYGDGDDCVQLRIVQPRRPCYKINDQIGPMASQRNIASWITSQGIAGWYFQVVKEGMIEHGMPVYLIERPYPFANLQTLWQLANQKQKVAAAIIEPWLAIDCLEDSWKKVLTKKIKP
ncbi:MOSC domain-containing protein [Psychrobacter lutiphocae]|uniref:MOSC domain-containing protein n=1 Tax=Psychrobacter lutiphocae TaxID=540500 RepID=UPI00036E43FF|nr:MOSC domain-containing protein [Psychrobacter lutiphocae]